MASSIRSFTATNFSLFYISLNLAAGLILAASTALSSF